MNRRSILKISAISPLVIAAGGVSSALAKQKDEIFSSFLSSTAIRGYDPVAYFTESKPVKGNKSYRVKWKGATWQFASQANLNRFKANPARYAPQYGGYCAWAVSHGYTASTQPDAWSIENGKLYLNYNRSVREKWLQNPRRHIRQGDANWPAVLSK